MTFIYLWFIIILVNELPCAWFFLGAGLFFFAWVIVTVILISIFTFGAPSVPPPDMNILPQMVLKVKKFFAIF